MASGKAAKPRRRKVARRKRPVVAKRRVRRDRAGDLGVAALQDQLEQKTRELNEALEQQAATAEVLGVINASRGDLQPVFEAMVEKARRLCDADAGHLALPVGDDYRSVAVAAMSREMEVLIGSVSYAPGRGTAIGRALAERHPVQISDIGTDTEHVARQAAHKGFIRTILGVPLLRDGEAIGAFGLSRQRIEPFSERQIELVRIFADQAVIAIENARLLGELRQSLEHQTATADVLRVISSSPGDLEPVLQTLLAKAVRICEANFGTLFVVEGDEYRTAAGHNMPSAFLEQRQRTPMVRMTGETALARVARTKRPVQIFDVAEDPAYRSDPQRLSFVSQTGARTVICVPMLKDGALVGAVAIYRQEVRPFADNQIELLTNFAAQAVIAIENTRLLSELRQSLAQQTATADVLRVISSSPGALEPVFLSILDNATRICRANFATLFLREGEALRVAAHHGSLTKAWDEQWRVGLLLQPDPELQAFQTLSGGQPLQVVDLSKAPSYLARNPKAVNSVETGGIRTMITVPMLKDGEAIGVITIFRTEVREFTEKQIALVTNFAAQAVIAIENTRLLSELRQSLDQQTAMADVLRVISSSPGELEPVFQAMLENAARICEAKFGTLYRFADRKFHLAAQFGSPPELIEAQRQRGPFAPTPGTLLDRLVSTRDITHTADYATEPGQSLSAKFGGARSAIALPMLKDGELIGIFAIFRQEVRPFTDKQIALLKNFAAQAIIAIENTRLLNELRQSLEQQTATADVLRVISTSPGDLEPVFRVMLENATRICEAKFGTLALCEGDALRAVALHGGREDYADERRRNPVFRPAPNVPVMRAVRMKQVQHVANMLSEQAYIDRDAAIVTMVETGGARTFLGVPMLKDDEAVGVIIIYRQEVRPFTDKQIALVQNFAAQAVIAIENTRLLNELRQRTDDLTQSLNELRTAQDRLVQTEKLASLGQLTAGIAHEIKNPLNFVNNFSSLSVELIGELQEELGKVKVDSAARDAITDVAETLRGNLEKIAHHGKRADAIVKNMLLHSREGSGDHRPVDVNALVEESLNLAYHGARAEKPGFNIVLVRSFDAAAGEVDLYPQEVTRVLLNIIANGFYAAHKRKSQAGGTDFEPTLVASTRTLGDRVEIRIRDNGTGIPPEIKEKMFNPFFTTKPAGEGTGLGLSISHDIIVKQHCGSMEVHTELGAFTEFRIVLPRGTSPR